MVYSHQPFHLKYRPINFDELVGQDVISLTLKQALITNKIAPAYLFCGPRGTGKTSSARIFAKSLNCLKYHEPNQSPCNKCELCKNINIGIALDIIEIDAASNTGVENIREIIERANFAPTQARWKVYVIDECHMLSTAASNALLKTIEEPPEKVVFILATTNPEKVLKTIQSRCQTFNFKRINSDDIYNHLLEITNKEKIDCADEGLRLISKRSNGGMRDAQRLLDQLSLIPNKITKRNVEELLGEVPEKDLLALMNSLIENIPDSVIKSCTDLYDLGNEPISILEGLLSITRDLLLNTVENNYSDLFYTSKEFQPEIEKFSKLITKSRIIEWHSYLKNLEYQIKNSNQPRLWLEIHLTSLLNIEDQQQLKNTKNIHHKEITKDKNIIFKQENNLKEDSKNINQEQKINSYNDKQDFNSNTKNIHHKEIIKDKKIIFKQENNLKEDSNNINQEQKINSYNDKQDFNSNPKNIDDESINLKEKWSLILSKLELPSTRMLLAQQAELISIQSNIVEIGLAPNWENMIKSRKAIIENAVKKIFGAHMSISFKSKKNDVYSAINKNHKNDISEKSINSFDLQNKHKEKSNLQNADSNIMSSRKFSESAEDSEKSSSKNLADFFNGQIVDTEE